MADSDTIRFPRFGSISDDTRFVYQAMAELGFLCDFGELNTDQMQFTLSLAACLKRIHGQEIWES